MSLIPPEKKENELVPVGLAIFGALAFFISPFGSFFFAITNAAITFIFLAPLALYLVYKIWSAINMVEAPCPTCGVTMQAYRGEGKSPNFCLSCGATVRATMDGKNLEICNVPPDFGRTGNSFLDDIISNLNDEDEGGERLGDKDLRGKQKRESTIIDVDVED